MGTQTQEKLGADVAQMASDLAAALALENDPALQSWLRSQGGARDVEPIHVRLGSPEVWARLDARGVVLVREAPPSGARFDLFGELRCDPALGPRMQASIRRTGAQARADRMLKGVFERTADPSRSRMAELLRWAPLLERAAYRFSARCIAGLHEVRRDLQAQTGSAPPARQGGLQAYWRLALANSHLGLLATTEGARPWLVGMADSFTWLDWTPSLPLVRERSLWFGAVAARNVARFGDAVLEKYLRALALATQPIKVFDATFGLLAIALDDPRVVPALRSALAGQAHAFLRQGGPYGGLQASVVDAALTCLADPEAADRAFLKAVGPLGPALEQGRGLLGRAAVRLDLTAPTGSQGYLGFSGLPRLLRTPLPEFYPTGSDQPSAASLPPLEIAAHLARAFKSGPQGSIELH
ncbi:hypothetical protein [Phenylobacterium sp.]|uniref:hypothetical protein n=1 Tax=Phenylobacterium sp. TaxID=1871053 RepID=UPI002FC9F5EE